MDESVLFAVDSDHLHHFVARETLGQDVVSVLQGDLGVTVGETVLPIAHWEHDRTGPLSVALNFAGELVVLVMGETFTNTAVLLNTLSTLEQWLAPMDLGELAELSGNSARFFEGVYELSPGSPLTLASMLRVLLINPTTQLDQETIAQDLPFTQIETLWIDALEAADGTVIIKRRHERATSLLDGVSTIPFEHLENPVTLQLDARDDDRQRSPFDTASPSEANIEGTTIDLAVEEDDAEIDLTGGRPAAAHSAGPTNPADWPMIIRGSSYVTAELPLHFDPTGSNIESISDELFAAGGHLALVVNIGDHATSPVETASVFRWDASMGQRSLFDLHSMDTDGQRRVLHLFVESASEPNRVLYLGTGEQLAQSDRNEPFTLWLKITPALDRRRLAILQSGRMPSEVEPHANEKPFSFASTRRSRPAHADGLTSNWVPNV